MEGYTTQITENLLNVFDLDSAAAWEELSRCFSSDPGHWKSTLVQQAKAYCLTGRFALMRIFCCRANGFRISDIDRPSIEPNAFDWQIGGKPFHFDSITPECALSMSPEESAQWLEFLEKAVQYSSDDELKTARQLLRKAWFDKDSAQCMAKWETEHCGISSSEAKQNAKCGGTLLSREDCMMLGHCLGFSLSEMEWFLLRVLQEGEGFRYRSSADLIDAYGFLSGSSLSEVEARKDQYSDECGEIKKAGLVADVGGTKDAADNLPTKVRLWALHPETANAQFLSYLKERAPYLDCPSQSAHRIYCNLAAFAMDLLFCIGKEIGSDGKPVAFAFEPSGVDQKIPPEDALADSLHDVIEESELTPSARFYFCQEGKVCFERCQRAAVMLMKANQRQSASSCADPYVPWRILSVDESGRPTPAGGAIHSSDTRIAEILSGRIQVEKCDLCFLLWITMNFVWQMTDSPDSETILNRIYDLKDVMQEALEKAALPGFYVPHVMEQSMMISILSGGSENDSAVVYESLISSFAATRKRFTDEQKRAIVRHRKEHPEQSLKQYAAELEITPRALKAILDKWLDRE